MEVPVLGIDIAKRKFQVALLMGNKCKNKSCPNTAEGHKELLGWLKRQGVEQVHACLEATGNYGEAVATALADAGHSVSLVNPARIQGFAQSEMSRTKNDQADAALIARFCRAMHPELWKPPAPEVRELRALVRRLADLHEMAQMEENRLESGVASEDVAASIQAHLKVLREEIKKTERLIRDQFNQHPGLKADRDLLVTIPGIGEQTAAVILGEIGSVQAFSSARQLAAYCGLTPKEKLSGTSVRGKTRLSKVGNAFLRKALFMPAMVAQRHNPIILAFSARLKANGKSTMAVLGACMRKLIHLAYGVLKTRRPFDSTWVAG